jgi:hypothetical protein
MTRKGSSYWSRCIREFGERDAWDGYVIGLVTMLRSRLLTTYVSRRFGHSAMQVSGREPWRICS